MESQSNGFIPQQMQRNTELPLHYSRTNKNNVIGDVGDRLNKAFEKGLDLAGLKKTKTGSGDKEKAYIVKSWTMLVFLGVCLLFLFVAGTVASVSYFDLVLVKRGYVHDASLNRALGRNAQKKLMTVHLQLQKALNTEVHETSRIEELSNQISNNLEITGDKILKLLDTEMDRSSLKDKISVLLKDQEKHVDKQSSKLVRQFKLKAEVAKKELRKIAEEVISDIELDTLEEKKYREKLKTLGVSNDRDFRREVSREEAKEFGIDSHDLEEEFGEFDNEDEDMVKKDLKQFFTKLEALDVPVIDEKILHEWEQKLNGVMELLDDEEKSMDDSSFRTYVEGEFALHWPNAPALPNADDSSVIDYFEARIYELKLMPHKQDLLDMNAGWQAGSLSGYQVLANIEHVAETEDLFLIYEWLGGFE